jgi:hypothetical protein
MMSFSVMSHMSWIVLKRHLVSCHELSWNVIYCHVMICPETSFSVLAFVCWRSLRPTNSGDTLLGKAINRTYKDAIVNDCMESNFHKKLWTPPTNTDVPPWVFKAECVKQTDVWKTSLVLPGYCGSKMLWKPVKPIILMTPSSGHSLIHGGAGRDWELEYMLKIY